METTMTENNEKDLRYNGEPSIILPHRPFFSVIVACYSSKDTIGILLQSIVDQDMKDDIEVVLSDDCSPDQSYNEVVDTFKDKICIRQVQTDYNFAPGNTRERGIEYATGEWITIADHDDQYIPGSLKKIKDELTRSNEQYYMVANFREVNFKTKKIVREMKHSMGWNHAKFYNMDNLWKAQNIHFKKDLMSHEDICISSQINCAMKHLNSTPKFSDTFCYIWYSRPTSVSRSKYGNDDGVDHNFLEIFFEDYINSTASVYFDKLEQGYIDKNYALQNVLEVVGYVYFYMQSFIFNHPDKYIAKNINLARELLINTKEVFDINNDDIYNWFAANGAANFATVEKSAIIGVGNFIPPYSLKEWLDMLHHDLKKRIVTSDMIHKE